VGQPSFGAWHFILRPSAVGLPFASPSTGGLPAGSSPDFVARLLAEHLEDYASTILVDNRPGAGGRLPFVMVLTPGDQIALFPMSTPSFDTTAGTRPRLAAAPMRRARP
jgi:hypothetical protein